MPTGRSLLMIASALIFFSVTLYAQDCSEQREPEAEARGNGPSYKQSLETFCNQINPGSVRIDEEEMADLVRKNEFFAAEAFRTIIHQHFCACRERGKALVRTESPHLETALALARQMKELFDKTVYEKTALAMEQWPLARIEPWLETRRSHMAYEKTLALPQELFTPNKKAVAPLSEALRRFRNLGDPLHTVWALVHVGSTQLNLGKVAEAKRSLEEAQQLAEEIGDYKALALSLQRRAVACLKLDDLPKGRRLFLQSDKLLRRMQNRLFLNHGRVIWGATLFERGHTTEAITTLKEQVADHLKRGEKRAAAGTLRNLACYLAETGTGGGEALAACRKARSIAEETGQHDVKASATQMLGLLEFDSGRLNEGLAHLEEAREFFANRNDLFSVSQIETGIVECLRALGQTDVARKRAEKMLLATQGRGHPQAEYGLRMILARIEGEQCNMASAMRWIAEAEALAAAQGSKTNLLYTCTEICKILVHGHRYAEALTYSEKTASLAKELGHERAVAFCSWQLGVIFRMLRRHELAIRHFEDYLNHPFLHDRKMDRLKVKSLIAACHTALGDLKRAEKEYRTIIDLSPPCTGDTAASTHCASVYNQLGRCLGKQGRTHEAIACYEKALDLLKTWPDDIPSWNTRCNIARTWLGQDRPDLARQAVAGLEQKLDDCLGNPGDLFDSAALLGLLLTRSDRPAEAFEFFETGLDARDRLIAFSSAFTDRSRCLFSEEMNWIHLPVIECCLALHAKRKDPAYLEQAILLDDRIRAQGFLATLAGWGLADEASRSAQRYPEIAKCRSRIVSLSARLKKENDQGAIRTALLHEHETLECLLDKIERTEPRGTGPMGSERLTVDEVKSLLGRDSAFVSFVLDKKSGFVLAANNEGCQIHEIKNPAAFRKDATTLCAFVEKGASGDAARFARVSRRLYRALFEPVEKILHGRSRIVLCPDSSLEKIPFCALVTGKPSGRMGQPLSFSDLPYLVRQYSLARVPSLSALRSLKERSLARTSNPDQAAPKSLLAIGGIPYGKAAANETGSGVNDSIAAIDRPRNELCELPKSRFEIEAIANLFPDRERTKLITGEAACERVLRETGIDRYSFLHFALHAEPDPKAPLFSNVVLHRGNDGDDGRWRAFEICETRINAELVVLSACATNVGEALKGEGSFGLVRSFLHAGADSVLATNWIVWDSFNPAFMSIFYASMLGTEGMARDEALRKAMLAAIDGRLSLDPEAVPGTSRKIGYNPPGTKKRDTAHPHYWAPFVLTGIR